MKKFVRLPASIFYLISGLCFVLYLFVNLNNRILIPPVTRLILLCIICIFAYWGSWLFSKTTSKECALKIMKITFSFFFVIYIFTLIALVLFDKYFGRAGLSIVKLWHSDNIRFYLRNSFNVIPFKTIYEYFYGAFVGLDISISTATTNILGNIIAFAPFAFFLPLFFKRYKSTKTFAFTVLTIVLFIEILQFILLTGSCDIDDVILNVFGALLTYEILNIPSIQRMLKKLTQL